MHFIIISKEDGFENESINNRYLNSVKAPSLISDNVEKIEIGDFIVYLYLYDQIIEEQEGNSYYFDGNRLLISNGIYSLDGNIVEDIKETFKNLDSRLYGDYQLISIDEKGNGFFKTPDFSLKQLFFYEDENCKILSSEIKLIIDGVQNFKEKKFVENYDLDFFYDSIYNEWGKRKFPKNTIFKNIKRIFPHDSKCFKEGKIIIFRNENINIPKLFKKQFECSRNLLYDRYYKELVNLTTKNLEMMKPNVSKIRLGLTGGFDSRLAAAILYKVCDKLEINFLCHTSGKMEHPDVVIAKKICKVLNIEHEHNIPDSGKGIYPQKIEEYMRSFYNFQGDRNSNDYWPIDRKIVDSDEINHSGMDAFKRYNMNLIYSGNRWFARSILFRNNFFFPLFYTENEIYFALSYGKGRDWTSDYKEFIYEILKRSEPKLLKVPFVGDPLPQTGVDSFSTIELSKFHEKIPFLWDYKFVKRELDFILKKNLYKKIGIKSRLLLDIIGLNELDFFLNPKIYKIIKKYRKNKISLLKTIKMLLKEKSNEIYPRNREFIEIKENDKNRLVKRKLVILMDYASVASLNSFEEIENILFEEN